MKLRAPFNYDTKKASQEAQLICKDPSLAVQDAADDCDINVMIQRMGLGPMMAENPRVPAYGDFTEITDYRGAIEAVRMADAQFMELPPQLRAHFENDPQKLMIYTETHGHENLVELGLDLTVPMSMRTQRSVKDDPPAAQTQ